jgi:hypothetical protein
LGGGGVLLSIFLSLNTVGAFAEGTVFTGIINLLPDSFVLPSIGLINIVYGNYSSVELGAINVVESSLFGAQAGIVNIVGQSTQGAQIGLFLNSNYDDMVGAQIGSVNINGGETTGLQIGLYNEVADILTGVQAGGFNFVGGRYTDGDQIGIINMSSGVFTGRQTGGINSLKEGINGLQSGIINYSKNFVEGGQIGAINVVTGSLTGLQLGLFNYTESVDDGLPIGLFSVVRDNGYFALETSYSNLSLDLRIISGLWYFYSGVSLAVSIAEIPSVSISFSLGSLIPILNNVFYNSAYFVPDIRFVMPITRYILPLILDEKTYNMVKEYMDVFSFSALVSPKFGFYLTKNVMLAAGPTFALEFNPDYIYPNFESVAAYIHEPDLRFVLGFEVLIRYELIY